MSTNPALHNLGMDWDRVTTVGSRGPYNLTFLRHVRAWIRRYSNFVATVDISCLCIGSNDIIDSVYIGHPELLAQDIILAAEALLNAGCKRVVVLPILFRSGISAMPRHLQRGATQEDINLAEQEYNRDVLEVNRLLKLSCDQHPKMSYRPLRGLKQNWRACLADGVHLTYQSMRTFFNDVRSSFVVEKNRIYA